MKLSEELVGVAVVEFAPKKEGRSMTMVLGPLVKKGAIKKAAPAKAAPASAAPAKEEKKSVVVETEATAPAAEVKSE